MDEEGVIFILAKYDGYCEDCQEPIYAGEQVGWNPETRCVYCSCCASCRDEYMGDER